MVSSALQHVTPHHPDPRHPTNLSNTRKLLMLFTLSFVAWNANYMAAAHLTAFPEIAHDYHVSIAAAANTVGVGILGLGTGALLWNPISQSIGRRTAMLLGWGLQFPCTFWIAFAKSYNSFCAGIFFCGFGGSVSQTVPAAIIADTFSPRHRGAAIALWSLFLLIGPLSAPIVGAAVMTAKEWKWLDYVLIMISGLSAILLVFLVPETMYIEAGASSGNRNVGAPTLTQGGSSIEEMDDAKDKAISEENEVGRVRTATPDQEKNFAPGRLGMAYKPWEEPKRFLWSAAQPILQMRYMTITIPSIWYSVVFAWSVGMTVVMPRTLPQPPWHFTTIKVGLCYFAGIIGGVIGKFAGGFFADGTVNYFVKRNGGGRTPEYRLWAALPQLVMVALGLLLFGLGFDHKKHWSMIVIGGMAPYYFANSALSGILQTYIVECHVEKAVHSVALFNFLKCIFAFAAPFFIPEWAFPNFEKAYVTQACVSTGSGLLILLALLFFGKKIRSAQNMPSFG